MGAFIHSGNTYNEGWYSEGEVVGYVDGNGRLSLQRKGGAALILLL